MFSNKPLTLPQNRWIYENKLLGWTLLKASCCTGLYQRKRYINTFEVLLVIELKTMYHFYVALQP